MRFLVTLLAASLVLATCAADPTGEESALPVLRLDQVETYYNIHRQKTDDLRFITEADVVAVSGDRAVLSDDDTDVYTLNPSGSPNPNWKRGERVRAVCSVKPNPYAPDENCITVHSHTNLFAARAPKIVTLEIEDINAGFTDMREVITRGVITDVFRDKTNPLYIYLMLSSGENDITLTVQNPTDATFKKAFALIDSAVRVKGLCVLGSNGTHRFIGRSIDLASLDDIIVLKAATNVYAQPLPSTARFPLMRQRQFPHRLSTRGTIIAAWSPQNALFRTDDGRCLRLHLSARSRMPQPGKRVEVRGFLRVNTFFAGLYNATTRRIDAIEQPPEEPLTLPLRKLIYDNAGRVAINPTLDGRLITLEGVVLDSLSTTPHQARCVIEQEGERVVVQLGDLSIPKTGSKVRVTGACRVTFEEYGKYLTRPLSIEVVTRKAEDVVLLAGPPYWTAERLKYIVLFSILGICAFILLCISLARLAKRRGRELAQNELKLIAAALKADERSRLGVELHDSIAQSVLAVTLQLDTVTLLTESDPPAAKKQLTVASRMLKACLKDIRTCIWDLHNQTFETEDMNEAIVKTLTPALSGAELHCDFQVPRERLSDNLTHAILCIMRELAANGVRHGKARNITIVGSLAGDKLTFTVTDDGEGFTPESAPGSAEGHFGIQGIRERLRHFQGTLVLTSAPGQGTHSVIELTLPQPQITNKKER